MNPNKLFQNIRLGGWSPFVIIAVTTLAAIAISIYCLLSGLNTIFQNLFYIPIIIACLYYTKRGFAFSVILSFIYLFLIIAFITDSIVIIAAFTRVFIFIGVAGIITLLSIKQKRYEWLLREDSFYTRNLIEASLDPLITISAEGKITDVNTATEKITGIDRERLIGSDFTDYFTEPEIAHAGYLKAFAQGQVIDYPLAIRHTSGAITEVLYNASVYKNKKGEVLGIFAAARDITERKRAEEAILNERQKFFTSLENAPFGMVLILQNGTFSYINQKFMVMFGYEPEDIPDGRTWFRKAYPDTAYRHEVISAWKEDLGKTGIGERRPKEFAVTCKDGSTKTINFIAVKLATGDNIMSCEDITERRNAEETLMESEEWLKNIYNNSPIAIEMYDQDGLLVDINPACCVLFGVESADTVKGFKLFDDPNIPQDKIDLLKLNEAIRYEAVYDFDLIKKLDLYATTRSGNILLDVMITPIIKRDNAVSDYLVQVIDITERKRVEEVIAEGQQRLSLAAKAGKVGIWDWDVENDELIWDESMYSLYGISKEDFSGAYEAWSRTLHPDDRQFAEGEIQAALRGELEYCPEFRIVQPDGTVRILQAASQTIRDQDGKPLRMIGTNIDITERKRAEEALRESEEKFFVAFKTSPYAITITQSEDGRFIDVNDAFLTMTGFIREETINNASIGMGLWADAEDRSRVVRELSVGGKIVGQEFRFKKKNGEILIGLFSAHFLRIKNNTYILSSINDITERKRVEDELKLSEINLRMILDSVDNAIFICTKNGKIIDVNSKMLEMYGVSREEVCSMSIEEDFSTPENPLNELPGIWESVMQGEERLFEWQARRPHDEFKFNVEVFLRKINLNNGDFILATVRDITERKRVEEEKSKLEAQLQQSQKMEAIGTLAGGIAHDFNNILSVIIGYTELAVEEDQKENKEQYLQEVLMGAERAKDLVKQILTFSRQDNHEKKPLDIKILLKEAVTFLRSSIPTTIEISQQITAEECNIMADPTQMHQVIMNLCVNASHAMKEAGGTLKIELANVELTKNEIPNYPDLKSGHYIKLAISDTGHGIEPVLIQRIFDPFFTTKSVDEGTGLGLSVVYGIIKTHDGVINVYSELGKGTSFNVYLPRILHSVAMKLDMDKPVIGGNERILFVDDEPLLVDMGMRMLFSLEYNTTGVKSSTEALDLFRADPESFDLVITDMTLPKMTGIDLSREILKIRQDIPIILCSGIRDPGTESQVKSMGIKSYLTKPLTKRELAQAIRDTLDGKEKKGKS